MAMQRCEWENGLLGREGSYQTGAFRGLAAWMIAESGSERCDGQPQNGAKWNPLNTMQAMPGATKYNAAGVKNYLTFLDGIDATLVTLHNGNYQAILDAIHTDGISAEDFCRAVGSTPWGTSTQGLLDALKVLQANRSLYYGLAIGP